MINPHPKSFSRWEKGLGDEGLSIASDIFLQRNDLSVMYTIPKSDTPGKAGGLMSVAAPRAGDVTGDYYSSFQMNKPQ